MKFRNLYNPDVVYEDYFEAYFIRPFIHHYADFSGSEPARAALLSFAAWLVLTAGIAGILMGQVGLLGPEVGFIFLYVVGGIWLAASVVPLAALAVRGSRGKRGPWKHSPRFLGVDALLSGAAILFFLFGLLMMTTTLRSENLNPNAGYDPEAEESPATAADSIREEPIFTYQESAPATQEADTLDLSDLDDPDAGDPDETFDPELSTDADAPEIPEATENAGESDNITPEKNQDL